MNTHSITQQDIERKQRELEAWGRQHRCADARCHKVSQAWVEEPNTGWRAWFAPVRRYPADLIRCSRCGQWVCKSHIVLTICRECRGY